MSHEEYLTHAYGLEGGVLSYTNFFGLNLHFYIIIIFF